CRQNVPLSKPSNHPGIRRLSDYLEDLHTGSRLPDAGRGNIHLFERRAGAPARSNQPDRRPTHAAGLEKIPADPAQTGRLISTGPGGLFIPRLIVRLSRGAATLPLTITQSEFTHEESKKM